MAAVMPAMPAPITTISLYSAIKSLLWRECPARSYSAFLYNKYSLSVLAGPWSVAAATGLAAARLHWVYWKGQAPAFCPDCIRFAPAWQSPRLCAGGRPCPDAKKGKSMQLLVCIIYLALAAAVVGAAGAVPPTRPPRRWPGRGSARWRRSVPGRMGGSPLALAAARPALCSCAAGDVAMGLYNLRCRPAALLWGVGAVCRRAFVLFGRAVGGGCPPTAGALVFAALAAAVLAWLLHRPPAGYGQAGRLRRGPTAFAVSLMAGQSAALALAAPGTGTAPVCRRRGAVLAVRPDFAVPVFFRRGGAAGRCTLLI